MEEKKEDKVEEVVEETMTEPTKETSQTTDVKSKVTTAGLVLGLVAPCISFIPIVNNFSFILGILAIIFGSIALTKDSKKVKGAIALALGVVAIVLTIIFQISFAKKVVNVFEDALNSLESEVKKDGGGEAEKDSAGNLVFKLGETADIEGLKVTFTNQNLNYTNTSEFYEVKDGMKVIWAEFEFENKGDTSKTVGSSDFTCFADGYSQKEYYGALDDELVMETLDKGQKAKGPVFFEVPENANEITLDYKWNLFSDQKVVFKVK